MDTFEKTAFDKILGGKGRAGKVYCALEDLLDAGYGRKERYTDLAFSIVPTSLSIQGIPKVIEFALHNGIFPSVGELEKSGLATEYFQKRADIELINSITEKTNKLKYLYSIYETTDWEFIKKQTYGKPMDNEEFLKTYEKYKLKFEQANHD